ncbi:MAG: 30S ribosomal protein S5 [Candidatus Thermoplasmatota archaeon]|nr:30S ribosomal protein S5 [Candidatus Thermoplasmatota archaeon]
MSNDPRDRDLSKWQPRTKLGKRVHSGEVESLAQALETGLPLREPEIVDTLAPRLEDDVIDVNMVQRMTDSGRRVRFRVAAVVGNKDGIVGLGQTRGREVGPTIRRAIDNAKLNLIQVRRGCGSWECGCYTPHTVPFKVTGKVSSVGVTLKPAPRGVGLAAGDIAKQVLTMAGIEDVWAFTSGQTRTTINFGKATFEALRETSRLRVMSTKAQELKIIEGPMVHQAESQGEGEHTHGGEQA